MKEDIKDGNFSIMIQKSNPKPNPVIYEFVTINDIFNAMTEENVDKFCKEFKQSLKVGIEFRELSKLQGVEAENEAQMPLMTWIDD